MTPQPGAPPLLGTDDARASSSPPLLLLAPATAAADDLVIDGRGWGHGVGLSQYGAYGYALREGRDHRFILGHYYTGSDATAPRPATRMRVRLKRARAPRISGATRARAAGGRRVRLRETADLPLPGARRRIASRSSTRRPAAPARGCARR